ncbi:MAG: hypothetical protein R8M71_01485 [Alphaproteobacteria bacterium]|nr:hypothetical protein [Alphaproteobacteria bacterium]
MMEYKQYVEPLLQYLKPLLEKNDIKDEYTADLVAGLKKEISAMKSPLFRLKNYKNQMATFGRFYYFLYRLYKGSLDSISLANGFYNNLHFEVHKSGDKRKATVDNKEPLKRYRGIIGRQVTHDHFSLNASNGYDNASHIYFVPRKGVDVMKLWKELYDFPLASDKNIKHLMYSFDVFSKIAKSMRFRDADATKNTIRTGAVNLQTEMLEEMDRPNKSAEQRKRISNLKAGSQESEMILQQMIEKQQALVDKLKADAMTKMTDIVNDGENVKTASLKTAQMKLNRVVEAQNKLFELKQKLKEMRTANKKWLQSTLKTIKRERADGFYGLQR